jgi:hypothetical protein
MFACGDDALARWAVEATDWQNRLLLDPSKRSDPAREWLRKKGVGLAKGRSVLENAKKFLVEREMDKRKRWNAIRIEAQRPAEAKAKPDAEAEAARPKSKPEEQPRLEPEADAKRLAKEKRLAQAKAVLEAEERARRDSEADARAQLDRWKETEADGREVYYLPILFLDRLVNWKRWKKRQGGLKSRQTAGTKKTQKKV